MHSQPPILNIHDVFRTIAAIYFGTIWSTYMSMQTSSLSRLYTTKIRQEHVFLTSYSKMRVDLAVQVRIFINASVMVAVCNNYSTYLKM